MEAKESESVIVVLPKMAIEKMHWGADTLVLAQTKMNGLTCTHHGFNAAVKWSIRISAITHSTQIKFCPMTTMTFSLKNNTHNNLSML